MAIATLGGHVSRAIDLFKQRSSMYFAIGGTTPWDIPNDPDDPTPGDFRLNDIIGLKKIDNAYLVVPDEEGTIQYRNQNWKIVATTDETIDINTTVATPGIESGSTSVPVESLDRLSVGTKIRVNNLYEGTILSIASSVLTLDTAAPVAIPTGSSVLAGAYVIGAKYVYVDCYLNYNEFPIATYRQIGLLTGVTPNTSSILLPANPPTVLTNQFTSLGTLEIIDNRIASTRDENQREQLSLIIEC